MILEFHTIIDELIFLSKSVKISKEHEFFYIEIGLNIAYYRKIVGYTQEQLAELAGISRTYISNIEASNMVRTFSLEVLLNIADALDIPPYKLFRM